MEARNRKIIDWYAKITGAEIKLPRFQRFEAWDPQRISSLMQMVIRDLPLGITLILEVGDGEKFVSRFLETAPQGGNRVLEHLLDGQQRLTALWRTFHNNYPGETYFVYLKEFDDHDSDADREDMSVYPFGRWVKKNGEKYPLWCDDPSDCLKRGLIPTHLLRPEDSQQVVDGWIDAAMAEHEPSDGVVELKRFLERKRRVSDRIREIRSTVANYNLPYLSLPPRTEKAVALDVFIKMNTNSKPLSTYDIIVAEVESEVGRSLHDLVAELIERHPDVGRYADASDLVLTTSALLQGQLPNQRGAWEMDRKRLVENWDVMERGLQQMATFLADEGIFDEQRLPTNAVLAPLAALFAIDVAASGDKRGRDVLLLRKYLWHAFFTDRYENSAASRAFSDFNAIRRVLGDEKKDTGGAYRIDDVPIFADHHFAEVDELLTAEWPKRASIRGRGILAVACRLGAFDFSTGAPIAIGNVDSRHYHHVYPDALLKECNIESFLSLNCALILDTTNVSIGRKTPLQYLTDRYKWTKEIIVRERLQSHLIPIDELAADGYEGLGQAAKAERVQRNFDAFLRRRAQLILKAVRQLADGRQLSAAELYAR